MEKVINKVNGTQYVKHTMEEGKTYTREELTKMLWQNEPKLCGEALCKSPSADRKPLDVLKGIFGFDDLKLKHNTYSLTKHSFEGIVNKVIQWGFDRKITTNGKPITQAIKTLEECHELLVAINTNNDVEIKDAIGDIVVTLIMQCELQGLDLGECVEAAYNEIKDRKGYLNEAGDFIKEVK